MGSATHALVEVDRMTRLRLTYKKTGLTHYVSDYVYADGTRVTKCSIEINEKDWTDDPEAMKRMCKRCRVATGTPGRQVYNYGPMAWKRGVRW